MSSEIVSGLKQPDLQVLGGINSATIDRDFPIEHDHGQFAANDAFNIELIAYQLGRWQHLSGELDLAGAQRTAFAGIATPSEEETTQLPQGVDAQAARHDRVGLEVAIEEPEIRMNIQLRADLTLAESSPMVVYGCNPVDHEHVVRWQSRVVGSENLALTASNQVFPAVRIRSDLVAHTRQDLVAPECHKGAYTHNYGGLKSAAILIDFQLA